MVVPEGSCGGKSPFCGIRVEVPKPSLPMSDGLYKG